MRYGDVFESRQDREVVMAVAPELSSGLRPTGWWSVVVLVPIPGVEYLETHPMRVLERDWWVPVQNRPE